MNSIDVSTAMHAKDAAAQHMGISIVESIPGHAVLHMTVQPFMSNGHGQCHGGMLFTLCDTAFAHACNNENQATVASGCDINFLRPVAIGTELAAVASQINQGKRSGLYEIRLTDRNSNRLVAHFIGRATRLGEPVISEAQHETTQ